MKRSTIVFCGLAALLIAAIGCSDVKRTPGKVYMPDMANSRAYETYSVNPVFADGRTSQGPVAGTVKRGDEYPVHIEMDNIGDTANYYASRSLPNPFDSLDAVQMKETERLYLINCGICHGAKLDGNGPLWKDGDGPFPAKPAALIGDAKYESMPAGQMFYSITYGKNLMGGYASQITAKQRWEIITYIKSKQGK
ncbi:MAG: cytochrome c [Chitinophagaceae bacterium]|jgi:mono/diheme cytochrome c family protein|nr:cytochrome c [Chitinophagaceae bacterium]